MDAAAGLDLRRGALGTGLGCQWRAGGETKGVPKWRGGDESWPFSTSNVQWRDGSVGLGRGTWTPMQICRSLSHPHKTAGDISKSSPLQEEKMDLATVLSLPGKTGPFAVIGLTATSL